MKNLAIAIVILVASMSATSHAAESIWEKRVLGNEVIYSTSLGNIYCGVQERADGDLNVYATDSSWYGKSVSNNAHVYAKGGHVENYTTATANGITREDAGYWVFAAKCADAAKQLPPEVRVKFNGAYGISN